MTTLRRAPHERAGPVSRLARWWRARPAPEGIRISKVGLWFVLFTLIIAGDRRGPNARTAARSQATLVR